MELESKDWLTGLLDGHALARTAVPPGSACVFIDLDNFSSINYAAGYEFGDAYIKIFAAFLRSNMRKSDTLFRFRGDEFVIICSPRVGMKKVDVKGLHSHINRIRYRSPLRFTYAIAQDVYTASCMCLSLKHNK